MPKRHKEVLMQHQKSHTRLSDARFLRFGMEISMTNRLAENIRVLRKERSLTQEQLAEVLGVTTGAVYKW